MIWNTQNNIQCKNIIVKISRVEYIYIYIYVYDQILQMII